MLKLLRRIASDDTAVKLLFDHVRNLGITALVLGAAVWKYRNSGTGYAYYLDMVIVALLVLFGLFLFFVNQFHAIAKLRASKNPQWLLQVVVQTYSVVAVSVVFSLLWRP